jgi:AraC-like DNA-binding protein
MNRITVPEFINTVCPSPFKKISIKGLALVEYRHTEKYINLEVLLSDNLILLLLKGTKHIKTQEGEFRLQKGDICFLRKGNHISSEIFSSEENCYEAFLAFISDDFIKEFMEHNMSMFEKENKQPVNIKSHIFPLSPFLKSTIESFFPIFAYEHELRESILKLKLHELLLNLIQSDPTSDFKNFLKQIFIEAKGNLSGIMESNYTKPYQLGDYARMTFCSLSKFKKDFKKTYGIPPKAWINSRRLERARSLLMNSDYDVAEVSFLVGFENYSHFIQLFRKKYNCTPKQFSKNRTKSAYQ